MEGTQARETVVRLVRGTGTPREWRFAAGTARTVLRIGTGAHCNWRVRAAGVAGHHLMLLWNGARLTAIETGASPALADRRPLRGAQVLSACRLEFGDAVFEVLAPDGDDRPRSLYRERLPDAATFAVGAPTADPSPASASEAAVTTLYEPPRPRESRARPAAPPPMRDALLLSTISAGVAAALSFLGAYWFLR